MFSPSPFRSRRSIRRASDQAGAALLSSAPALSDCLAGGCRPHNRVHARDRRDRGRRDGEPGSHAGPRPHRPKPSTRLCQRQHHGRALHRAGGNSTE
eukprot:7056900-Pyramimonas_sp.AAC.2